MERHIFAACGAIAIAGITLAAQTPSPSQPPTPAPSTAQAGTITIQGCLKPAAGSPTGSTTGTAGATGAGATGTAGTAGAAGAGAMQYLLTDAEIKSGSAGAAGTTPSANEDEFVLRPEGASVNLAPHLNHQVEVVGRMAPAAAGGGAAASPSTGKPALTVTSVKMLSAECK